MTGRRGQAGGSAPESGAAVGRRPDTPATFGPLYGAVRGVLGADGGCGVPSRGCHLRGVMREATWSEHCPHARTGAAGDASGCGCCRREVAADTIRPVLGGEIVLPDVLHPGRGRARRADELPGATNSPSRGDGRVHDVRSATPAARCRPDIPGLAGARLRGLVRLGGARWASGSRRTSRSTPSAGYSRVASSPAAGTCNQPGRGGDHGLHAAADPLRDRAAAALLPMTDVRTELLRPRRAGTAPTRAPPRTGTSSWGEDVRRRSPGLPRALPGEPEGRRPDRFHDEKVDVTVDGVPKAPSPLR